MGIFGTIFPGVLFTMKVPVKRAGKDKFIWICPNIWQTESYELIE